MMINVNLKQYWFVVSLSVFIFYICTVVCFYCQHYFHAQTGGRFLLLEVHLFFKWIVGRSGRSSGATRIFQ